MGSPLVAGAHRSLAVRLAVLVGIFGIATLATFGGSTPASAQVSCADWQTGWVVSTADDFNEAVTCHNLGWPGTTNIILLNSIAASDVAGDAVFEPIIGGDLVIVGEGHQLSRGGAAGNDAIPVLAIETTSSDVIGTIQLGIVVGPDDIAGIEHNGSGFLDLSVTSIVSDQAGSSATGVVTSGALAVRYSLIEGFSVGVQMTSSDLQVVQSTIASTGIDVELLGETATNIENSTLGGPIGIKFDRGLTRVVNATLIGDGALASATSSEESLVTFESSVVNTCSADEVLPGIMPGPGWGDEGNNAGDCFFGGVPVPLTLADNGCDRRTPHGCPSTAAIDETSSAFNVGSCAISTDQRGAARTPLGAGCDAGSYEYGCDPAFGLDVVVSDAEEFVAAILCHNLGVFGNSNITLLNEISATQLSETGAVFPRISAGELTIIGEGHSIRRGFNAATDPMPVLASGSDVELRLIEVGIQVGPDDTAGIQHDGDGDLHLIATSISPWSASTPATGVITLGERALFVMRDSTIQGLLVGLHLGSQTNIIETSTVESIGVDVAWVGQGIGGIFNSTLSAPVGIELHSAGLSVENSTILGDAAALSAAAGPNTYVTFKSSIVNTCTADEFLTETQPGPGWADLGNNVGGCFDESEPVALQLADHGCEYTSPVGCARTAAIDVNSPAFQAGNCEPGLASENTFDQRGRPRTPAGPGCDAGSYEYDPCFGQTSQSFVVDSKATLDEAIACFNQGTLGAGIYDITLNADIAILDEGYERDAEIASINQPQPGFSLVINGAGHMVTAPSVIGINVGDNPPPPTASLLSMAPTNSAPVDIQDLVFHTLVDSVNTTQFVWNQSAASLSIRASALLDEYGFVGRGAVRSTGGGDLSVLQSFFSGAFGVSVKGAAANVTIAQSGFVAYEEASFAPALVIEAGNFEIRNSTFEKTDIFSGVDVTGTVSNSTVRGAGIVGNAPIVIESSIVNSCGPDVVDGGNNVGGCFGAFIELVQASSNGCVGITPSGCPPTIRLAANSPARGAGDCTGLALDQRGEPRTPVGPGCDAGAFEADPVPPGDVTDSGAVDNADVQALLVWLAGGPEPAALSAGDLTGDSFVKLDDALAIAQLVAAGG